jgi:magnesium chelatase family protein
MSIPTAARALAATLLGVDARPIQVEALLDPDSSSLRVMGLSEAAARETRGRVQAALRSLDLPPKGILINLTPSNCPKEPGLLDLAIALAVLVAHGRLPQEALDQRLIVGELTLDGDLLPVRGSLAIADLALELGVRELLLPLENVPVAACLPGVPSLIGIRELHQTIEHLTGLTAIRPADPSMSGQASESPHVDLSEVRGQESSKRALEIAAAGGHPLLLLGPPGSGKTMLARRLPSLLPPPTEHEAMALTRIESLVTLDPQVGLSRTRPFRCPHSGTSLAGLLGGGTPARPGEATLAHLGVLFLDDIPEFARATLEALRQALDEQTVRIYSSQTWITLPASFQLIAAMSACPCGNLGDHRYVCNCSPAFVDRYRARLSPILSRIQISAEVPAIRMDEIRSPAGETSAAIAARVASVRRVQAARFPADALQPLNAAMTDQQLETHCGLDIPGRALLSTATEKLGLSFSQAQRYLKVARTVADLSGSDSIRASHLAEALQYRFPSRS